jgi:hypothetical protein
MDQKRPKAMESEEHPQTIVSNLIQLFQSYKSDCFTTSLVQTAWIQMPQEVAVLQLYQCY